MWKLPRIYQSSMSYTDQSSSVLHDLSSIQPMSTKNSVEDRVLLIDFDQYIDRSV